MPYCCRSIQQVIIHLRTFNWKVHNSATLIFRGGKRKCISKKLKSRVTKSAWQPLIFHTEKTDTANNSQVIHGLYTWGGKAYGRMRLPADPWLYQGQGDLRLAPIPLTLTSFAIASVNGWDNRRQSKTVPCIWRTRWRGMGWDFGVPPTHSWSVVSHVNLDIPANTLLEDPQGTVGDFDWLHPLEVTILWLAQCAGPQHTGKNKSSSTFAHFCFKQCQDWIVGNSDCHLQIDNAKPRLGFQPMVHPPIAVLQASPNRL